jgi:hypothetical protein
MTTLLDSFTPIGVRDVFLPFLASYRPIWLGLGAVAFDLVLALTVTSLLRARVGYRAWRSLHWLAYAAWPVAVFHGLGTGSDARFGWLQALTVACVGVVAAAVAWRAHAAAGPPARRAVLGATTAAVAVVGVLWYANGPGGPGWAKRAGTPSALLARSTPPVTARRLPTHVVASVPERFNARLRGSIASVVDQSTGLVRVDIRARTTGGVRGLLWVRLQGRPVDDGGVAMSASGVAFGPTAAPNLYVGNVTALDGTQLAVLLRDSAGRRLALDVALNVESATRRVTGTLTAGPQ